MKTMSFDYFLPKQFIFDHIMNNENNFSLWTTANWSRYFLIPNNQELANGNFVIITSTGNKKEVDPDALAPFEITEEAAKSHVQAEMSQALKKAKNGLSNFIAMAAAQAAKGNTPSDTTHSESGAKLVAELLDITPEEVRNNPEAAKDGLRQVLSVAVREVIQGVTSQDPEQLEAVRIRMHTLRTTLQSQGFEVDETLEEFPEKLREKLLNSLSQKISTEPIGAVANFLRDLAEKTPEKPLQDTAPSEPIKTPETISQNASSTQSIFQAIVNFFKEDNWLFAQIKKQSALRLAFEGKNGKCDCYAQARETQQQFVFYSVCPVKVPKPKLGAVGEFINRANSGMIIGNFELNFAVEEIRYKTSIDVEGDRLTSALIKRLVYANVMMMDEYLPGIRSVIEGDVEPEDAIAQIER
jgi:hypothetical protein